nr:hypothetical protein GCM10017745_63610 [Saccharothrix mutabilis subsp. capreolus]
MPNQLMPVRRTGVPALSTILLPLVRRYPVAADATCSVPTETTTPATATAAAASAPKTVLRCRIPLSFELPRDLGALPDGA